MTRTTHGEFRIYKTIVNGRDTYDIRVVRFIDNGPSVVDNDGITASHRSLESLRIVMDAMMKAFGQPVLEESDLVGE